MRHASRRAFFAGSLLWLGASRSAKAADPPAATQFLLFETSTCPFCRAWLRDVAPGWQASDYGRIAPLRRVDLGQAIPEDLAWIMLRPRVTPTFVLVSQGRELGRLIGYQGAELFWIGAASLMAELFPNP